MKKNIRIASAAAAALLAVAPVAANVVNVANAATATDGTTVNPSTQPEVTPSGSVITTPAKTVNAGSFTEAPVVGASDISLTNGFSISRIASVGNYYDSLEHAEQGVAGSTEGRMNPYTSKLQAGHTYYQVLSLDVVAPKVGSNYSFDLNVAGQTVSAATVQNVSGKSSDSGLLTNIKAIVKVTAIDPNDTTKPYFTFQGSVYRNGDTIDWPASSTNSVDAIANALRFGKYDAKQGDSTLRFHLSGADNAGKNINWNDLKSMVKSSLAAQNISVDANGKFTVPANGFYVDLTQASPLNPDNKATVRVAFKGFVDASKSPVIHLTHDGIAEDAVANGVAGSDNGWQKDVTVTVKYGSKFDPMAPNGNKIWAEYSRTNKNTLSRYSLVATNNPVDTTVPGVYNVTVSAVNTDGYKTTWTYKVKVKGQSTDTRKEVKYVAGYGVNIWSMQAAGQRAFTGDRAADGSLWYTFDTKTVDGIEFTRISKNKDGKNDNTWIPSEYINGSEQAKSETTTDTKTDENAETYLRGSLVVTYNG
ncbi:hypothetical protein ONZ77_04020, partial [Lactobacillus mulieris]|nr:hypothetical protein [Lactobacillus mulieris]